MVDVEVVLAVFVEKKAPKVGGVGDVGDLSEFFGEGELDEIFESGKANVGKPLFDGHAT